MSLSFKVELVLSHMGQRITVSDHDIVTDQMVNHAWSIIDNFLMDALDDADIEDERYREIFIELLYKVIYREMVTLRLLPMREDAAMKRILAGKRPYNPRQQKGDDHA